MPPDLQAVLSLPRAASADDSGSTAGRVYRVLVGSAIVAGLAAIGYYLLNGALFLPIRRAIDAGFVAAWILKPGMILVRLGFLLLVLRTLLWFVYRPFAAATREAAPTMTVVIPAYNEGSMVEQSIESVAAARYPIGRLEILVVDDGSTDDTWTYIQRAAARHPGLVTAVRLARNQGKRVALASGFRAARGSILVTIDSDSVIEAGALLAMAGPFKDPRVGAVAGKVTVLNRDQGIIPRMLHVAFVLSFDFQRSVQSIYRTVYCCPGALAAYRASVVHEVLEPWLAQRFLGVGCTYGEDRALTNSILERGFDTVYQGSAIVHTLVPVTYAQLCKMYLRWDRSYVREEIRFARIVWKRPLVPMLIAAFDKLITNLRFPVAWSVALMVALIAVADPMALLRILLVIGIGAGFYMLYYAYMERSMRFVHGIIYSYFSFFALWWIFPYAILTVRSRSWMTR
ncbi:poly-beta-1,6-N-acetyl-D-glucosamine synthase [mine drainage metagenome]|uniref:Poly-beta-1,6-N-acetyl-D-glucosamine synthase n=1 Tax=mine drainage metagenome TaxID=410659 RepID=A0A1J5RRM0_9ZZZZ